MNHDELAHYTAALDEIYRLRRLLVHEAGVRRADLTLLSYPKSRRKFAEESIARMEASAIGSAEAVADRLDSKSLRYLMRDLGIETLTRQDWEERRGRPIAVMSRREVGRE